MSDKVMRTYNLTRELSNKVRETAFVRRLSQSEFVREILEEYFASQSKKSAKRDSES